jgi:hypothetical protein
MRFYDFGPPIPQPIMLFATECSEVNHEHWKQYLENYPGEKWPAAIDWEAPEIKTKKEL